MYLFNHRRSLIVYSGVLILFIQISGAKYVPEDNTIPKLIRNQMSEKYDDSWYDLIPDIDFSLETNKKNESVLCIHFEKSDINNENGESRKKKNKKKGGMMKFMPMFLLPFILQSAMLPMVLMSIKIMLIKSIFIGKMAIILGLINAVRKAYNDGHQRLAVEHYGYTGGGVGGEMGAWIN